MTEYLCPIIVDDGKPRTMCLRASENALGPLECHDPKSGATTLAATVAADSRSQISGLAVPNSSCCVQGGKCHWVWFFVIVFAVILLAMLVVWLLRHHTSNKYNNDMLSKRTRIVSTSPSGIVTAQETSRYI